MDSKLFPIIGIILIALIAVASVGYDTFYYIPSDKEKQNTCTPNMGCALSKCDCLCYQSDQLPELKKSAICNTDCKTYNNVTGCKCSNNVCLELKSK